MDFLHFAYPIPTLPNCMFNLPNNPIACIIYWKTFCIFETIYYFPHIWNNLSQSYVNWHGLVVFSYLKFFHSLKYNSTLQYTCHASFSSITFHSKSYLQMMFPHAYIYFTLFASKYFLLSVFLISYCSLILLSAIKCLCFLTLTFKIFLQFLFPNKNSYQNGSNFD